MITFSNTIKLITLIWLTNILSAGYCNADNPELNCMIAPQRDLKGIISLIPRKDVQGIVSRKIAVVNKCAKGFENKDIIEKCEGLVRRSFIYDPELFRPMINKTKNVAYWNIHCATCNNDTETEFETSLTWNRYIIDEIGTCKKLQLRIQRSEVDDLYNLTQTFISEGAELVAGLLDGTQLECSIDGKWPFNLLYNVIPCLYEELSKGQDTRLKQCQYAEKTGRLCKKMSPSRGGS